jgi:hypothetical protein
MNAFLFEWVEVHFFEDFFKKPLYNQILDFAKNSKAISSADSSKLKLLFLQKPVRVLSCLSSPPTHHSFLNRNEQKQKQKKTSSRPVPAPLVSRSIDIVEVSAAAIAEQLTLIGSSFSFLS